MTYCYNSAAADIYAHEQGIEGGRQMWLESYRDEIESRLNAGESICTGAASYTKAEILGEELELGDFILLAEAATQRSRQIGTEQTNIDLLLDRCDEIISEWLDEHIEAIAATEYSDAA